MIAKEIQSLPKDLKERLYYTGNFTFDELHVLLQKNDYSKSETITEKLLQLYSKQNKHLEEEIQQLIKKKAANEESNKLYGMLSRFPKWIVLTRF